MTRIRPTTFEAVDDDPLLELEQIRPVPVQRTPATSKVREIASETGFTARHGEMRGQCAFSKDYIPPFCLRCYGGLSRNEPFPC